MGYELFRIGSKWFAAAVSNLRASTPYRVSARRAALWARVGAGVLVATFAARAVAEPNPFQAWADFVMSPPRVYRGPTLPFPDGVARPSLQGFRVCSQLWPVCVHAPATLDARRVQRALAAFEGAVAWLDAEGWPLPYPDAGLGGSSDFDVYLIEDSAQATAVGVAADAALGFGEFDGATTYGLLDAALPDAELERCAVDALAQAGLHAHNPAEAEGARRAAAAFVTARFSGVYGCDDALEDAQRAPALGLIGSNPPAVAAGALLLTMLSRRHDASSGRFVRGAFELARQQSKSATVLHARPTVWQALSASLEHAGESLDHVVEEFAVARYFATRAAGPLPQLPRAASIDARWGPPLARLPAHVPAEEPPLATYGSEYLRIDTTGARAGVQLKLWLRGEPGARWSLAAVRLDGSGRELGRMSAPARRVPDSFLPIELSPDTAEVLIVVTKLPLTQPDPTLLPENDAHYFKLILDTNRATTDGSSSPATVYTVPATR